LYVEIVNIVITGASRGIGESVTKTFATRGNHQIFILSRNIDKLEELALLCKSLNQNTKILPLKTDLTDPSEIEKSVNKILLITSSIDILINNAGLALRKPFESFEYKEIELIMKTNFYGPAHLIYLLLPALIAAGNSHVINISSMSGFQGSRKFPGLTYYGASKAALAGLTEALSEEYKGRGVSFNCLALGAVQTEMFSEVFPGYAAPISTEKIADFIVEFALNAHQYLQGKIIPVSLADP
jgi:3-oxoacyl-[acyl-carrier protein] reductase